MGTEGYAWDVGAVGGDNPILPIDTTCGHIHHRQERWVIRQRLHEVFHTPHGSRVDTNVAQSVGYFYGEEQIIVQ
jgi:hypothetical protein